MTHLSESEFVDLAENDTALDPRRAAHVAACASCREQLETLRSMLRESERVEVPEPSPLFWEHLSNRVRAELAGEPLPQRGWNGFGLRGLVPLAVAAALILAILTGVQLMRIGPHDGAGRVVGNRPSIVIPAGRPEGTPDADNADVWALLTAVASDVAFEDARAAGMHVLPAAIDHAVQDLSEEELTELGRLLQSELKRSSD